MKRSEMFIGRPVYWALAAAIIACLAALGLAKLHVRDFIPFQFAVLALAAIAVVAIMCLYRPGERVTREPLEDEEPPDA